MSQTQEIQPQLFGRLMKSQDFPQIHDEQLAQQEALQPPRIDPIMSVASAVSGEPFGVINPASVFKKILKDVLFQHIMSSVVDKVRSTPADDEAFWYHGTNGPFAEKDTIENITKQGLQGGWFADRPIPAYGPNYIAVKGRDLPPGMTDRGLSGTFEGKRWSSPDVKIPEYRPDRYYSPTTSKSGDQVYSVHPSRLYKATKEGIVDDIPLAEQRAGEKATTKLSSQLFKQILEETE